MSKQPCPGCKRVCDERKAKDVCQDCQLLLKVGQAAVDETDNDENKEIFPMSLPSWMPYMPRAGDMGKMLLKLFKLASMGRAHKKREHLQFGIWVDGEDKLIPPTRDRDGGHDVYYKYRKAHIEFIREFWDALEEQLEDVFQEGHAEGRALLRGLAAGELSTADFDVEVERIESNGRRNRKRRRSR